MDNFALGFSGAYHDPASLGYPLGHGYRWYLPGMMGFNAPDSFSPFGPGGINTRVYCEGDPINRTDPTGHVSFELSLFLGLLGMMPRVGRDAVADVSEGIATSIEEVARSSEPVSAESARRASTDAITGSKPSFVYRLDERPPGDIFEEGFSSWGFERDVAKHVAGASTRNKTSAYIATTDDLHYMERFANLYGRAQLRLRGAAQENLYVYKIRVQPNFQNVSELIKNVPQLPFEHASYVERQREWTALLRIFPHDIIQCQAYIYDNGAYLPGEIKTRVASRLIRSHSSLF